MMANIKMIFEIIKMIGMFLKLVEGSINEAQYIAEVRKLKKSAKKASEGSLLDRLRGGREVEDNFNDNIDS